MTSRLFSSTNRRLRFESLEDRTLLAVTTLSPQLTQIYTDVLGTPAGIAPIAGGGFNVTYQGDSFFGATGEFFAQPFNELTAFPLLPATQFPAPATLGSPLLTALTADMADELNLLADDTLALASDGSVYAYRHSTGKMGLLFNARLLAVDTSSAFDMALGTARNFDGVIFPSASTYFDIAVYAGQNFTDILLTAESVAGTYPFVMRVRCADGQIQSAKVLVTTTGRPPLVAQTVTPGIAVNDRGTVVTSMFTNLGFSRIATFGISFDQTSIGTLGRSPSFPFNRELWSHGISTTPAGDFVLTTLIESSGTPEIAVVGRDGSNLFLVPLANYPLGPDPGSTMPVSPFQLDSAVGAATGDIFITTNIEANDPRITHPRREIRRLDFPPITELEFAALPLVVSTETGTLEPVIEATDQDDLFVDVFVQNTGTLSTLAAITILVDASIVATEIALPLGNLLFLEDVPLGRLSPGNHVVSALIDSFGLIPELDESNNVTFWPITINVAARPGDYNRDGAVSEADYSVWAASFAQAGDGLAADGNQNAIVDAADYVVWRKALPTTNAQAVSNRDGAGDGTIDDEDRGVWAAHFRDSLPPPRAGGGVDALKLPAQQLASTVQSRSPVVNEGEIANDKPVVPDWKTAGARGPTRMVGDSRLRAELPIVAVRQDRALLAWLDSSTAVQQRTDGFSDVAPAKEITVASSDFVESLDHSFAVFDR
jgi:hypothetical protein